MTPEGKVKAEIREYLKSIGAYYVQPIGSGYGAASLDFFVCYRGRFIAIEAKRPGGKPTPRQALIMQEVLEAGGYPLLVDDVDELKRFIERWHWPQLILNERFF